MSKNNSFSGSIKIRDYSEPLQSQRETTSYGERMMYVASFDNDVLPLSHDIAKYETQMIRTWRQMARNPYIDFAIDDIINEMLSIEEDEVFPIDIDLNNTKLSDTIRTKIHEEFINIQKLMKFNKKSYGLLRDWYTDGKAYYFIKFNTSGKEIIDIISLDPIRTKKITGSDGNVSYIYQDIDLTNTMLEIPENQMIEVNSGMMDEKHQIWVSYLNKAFVPLNQVNSIEDALVIYRLSRAPERRVFYVDVGELPKSKAEQYMREIINNYRNKMEYDSNTGTIKEKVQHMSLLDDIWLPRRDGSRGTEVSTLAGGQNLGNVEDIDYFIKKLFRSLNIPFSRWGGDESAANVIGRTTEISRDEVKYGKFIQRLRQQYNSVFYILLRSSLNNKNIILGSELDKERDEIIFKWNSENMFSTFRKFDILDERANMIEKYMPQVGKLVSIDWIRKEILGQTDEDIKIIDKQIETEKQKMKEFSQIDNPDMNEE